MLVGWLAGDEMPNLITIHPIRIHTHTQIHIHLGTKQQQHQRQFPLGMTNEKYEEKKKKRAGDDVEETWGVEVAVVGWAHDCRIYTKMAR